ncbi:tripartite tricarboxylate transporter substrate binding protein [Ramlibacter sp. G-1-2-2]|uniref:Tripartite tricarboxylate transporter substrate binding protein n=1 Tax=Ramlibacter agri TaxID=2728837 RepID=A0A848H135_9BURK|nr:tripartite tricarboxylate transporter substrate binding protein [Ramlibacter agri]NML42830.1 tripartite tricarboxylate transporter substrate binding protein [Ramlibacter agri]
MNKTRRTLLQAAGWGSLSALAAPGLAWAQDYPRQAITLNVGYGPGDNMDLMARMLATKVEKMLGQPVVVMNKPGAAGAVALVSLAKEKPDGYQLAAVLDTALARLPLLRKLSYSLEDFTPVMQYASGATGVVVKADSPWKTLPELIAYAKANPGKVSYTTTGPGTTMHVAFQFIEKQAGIEWTHVPYPAAMQGLAAVLGGHVTANVAAPQWANDVKNGNLRLLAVLSEKRMSGFPEVPTLKELGYDFAADSGSDIVAPKGMPPAIVKRLADAFSKAAQDPEYVKLVHQLQLETNYRDSEDLKRYLEGTKKGFAKLIVDMKIPTDFDSAK